jgi:hypothetical protein
MALGVVSADAMGGTVYGAPPYGIFPMDAGDSGKPPNDGGANE